MRPRDFITFIARGAGGCSLAARAQQPALPVIESWECDAPEHAHPRGMGARRIAMRTVRLVLAETAAALALILGSHGASAQPDLEPMIFFVAKGERNACGPGCSEWIAAEGMFEGPKVEQRFRDLLATLNGRNLPIVFNSLGGVIGEALVLGRILRERRMAASVGESYPEGCKARIAADESCRRIMAANRELKAQLRTAGAACSSACVYALLGASERHVPPDARVGIHAATPTAVSSQPGWLTVEQMHNNRKRYILEMGGNPDLQDAAIKTRPPGVHVLSREELVRYRVETSAPYESDWMKYQEPRGPMRSYMLKAVTAARGADGTEFRTTNLRMTCAERRPATSIEYQREPRSNEIGISTVIRIAAGNEVKTLQRTTPSRGDDRYQTIADRQFVQKALTAGGIVVTETFSPRNARPWSREIKFSAAGLEQALRTPLKNCGAS
jgi:hypothetical protein